MDYNEGKNKKLITITIHRLSKIALSHAISGVDIVAPSSMMDGQVQRIKKNLDSDGYNKTQILSFSAKQSSSFINHLDPKFYSSTVSEIDKSTYQVSYCNPRKY